MRQVFQVCGECHDQPCPETLLRGRIPLATRYWVACPCSREPQTPCNVDFCPRRSPSDTQPGPRPAEGDSTNSIRQIYIPAKLSDRLMVLSVVIQVYVCIYMPRPISAHLLVDCLGTGNNMPFVGISGLFPLIGYLLSFSPPPLLHSFFILSSRIL